MLLPKDAEAPIVKLRQSRGGALDLHQRRGNLVAQAGLGVGVGFLHERLIEKRFDDRHFVAAVALGALQAVAPDPRLRRAKHFR